MKGVRRKNDFALRTLVSGAAVANGAMADAV
jgi:hypothetical protein